MQSQEHFYIGGEWRAAHGSGWITAINPATEEEVGRTRSGSTEDIDAAVVAARAAFDTGPWPRMSHAERGAIIRKAAAYLTENAEAIAWTITSEMGSPITQSRTVQVPRAVQILEYFAGLADTYPWTERRATYDAFNAGSDIVVEREPVGVVAAIVPWNGPLIVASMKLAPALMAGCTVVLKPSEDAAMSFKAFAEAFEHAGLPAGVLNVVPADRVVGEYLVTHPGVDKVSITGSTAAGKRIASLCGGMMRPFTGELGGKGVALLMEDVDVSSVLEGLTFPMTLISGQACNAPSRILLPRSRFAELSEALAERITQLPFGDPREDATFMGPLSCQRQRDRVKGYIDLGIKEGARTMIGGGTPENKGWYVQPTLFSGVDNRMRIAQEEIFGPVWCLIAYDTVDDAVRIANDSDYGLESSIWTTNASEAVKVARRIRCGTVGINSHNLDMAAPFGGKKASGIGRECGIEGIADYTEIKAIFAPVGTPF